jgi:hypothetical protein
MNHADIDEPFALSTGTIMLKCTIPACSSFAKLEKHGVGVTLLSKVVS